MEKVSAQRDEFCACCGYPFDTGDQCLDVSGEGGPLACGKKCADWLVEQEMERQFPRNGSQTLSCFL